MLIEIGDTHKWIIAIGEQSHCICIDSSAFFLVQRRKTTMHDARASTAEEETNLYSSLME